jgi:large subunit ribosomal protein L10
MTKEEKFKVVDELAERLSNTDYFYIADASGMTVEQTVALRRKCYEQGVGYKVVKNSLIKKALERLDADYATFNEEGVLRGFSAVLFSESGSAPARIIKDYRKETNAEKPLLKGASIEAALYIGDDQLETLSKLKSKEELIGEVIMLLQSPARRIVGAAKSGGGRLAGLVKGIAEKEG